MWLAVMPPHLGGLLTSATTPNRLLYSKLLLVKVFYLNKRKETDLLGLECEAIHCNMKTSPMATSLKAKTSALATALNCS